MLTLTQINIYPVKSLDGFSTQEAVVERRGLQYDRRWLITDMDGIFMTQRTNGKMALLRATIEDNALNIKEKQNEQNYIKIPLNTDGTSRENREGVASSNVVVWDDTMSATHISEEANAWLSDFLQKKCQLVYMPDTTERRVEAKYNRGADIVSFADGYPFLMIGEASIADLNSRLDTPLSIRRFRANFIMAGGTPFQEDTFAHFTIGDVPFEGVKPCARCVLTTRDPDTGIKGREPLATLTTYRQQGTKILFGQNVIWDFKKWDKEMLPIVKVGDSISF